MRDSTSFHLSLRVTASHDLFVQLRSGDMDSEQMEAVRPHAKMPARELLSACDCPAEQQHCSHRTATVSMLACAEAGHATASDGLQRSRLQRQLELNDAQLLLFLGVFGFWIGDGSLSSAPLGCDSNAVTFCLGKRGDVAWLHEQLAALGLAAADVHGSMAGSSSPACSVTDPRWLHFFSKQSEWHKQTHSADGTASIRQLPATPHLPSWLMMELRPAELRLLIEGVRRACGGGEHQLIPTSSAAFRDQLLQALLHCGFSPHARLAFSAGATRGYRLRDDNDDHRLYTVQYVQKLSQEEQASFSPVQAALDCWTVSWSAPASGNKAAAACCRPSLRRQSSFKQQSYDAQRDGRIWCVSVGHRDHLILAQRAERDACRQITRQSRPVVVGQCCLDLDLAESFWRHLLQQPLTESDLASFDFTAHRSLQFRDPQTEAEWSEEQWEEYLGWLSFTTVASDNRTTLPLLPHGDLLRVSYSDRALYRRLAVQARLYESALQVSVIRQGLHSVIPQQALDLLSWQELELRVCGRPTVDLDVLKRHTVYSPSTYSLQSAIVQQFWYVLAGFTQDELAAFLQFAWARSRLPSEMGSYRMQLNILEKANPDSLPTAETCFFNVNMPKYTSSETMRAKIRMALLCGTITS